MSGDTPPVLEDRGRDTALCRLDEIADPGSRGFRVGERDALFVVRRGGAVFGYVNICPHGGTPLDWKDGVFLTVHKDLIQCATHGAQFDIASGACVAGPCPGRSLAGIALRIEGGMVMLDR